MRYFKLTIAYDGTDFHGWQIQANKPTVQGEIVSVLRRLTQENVQLLGAGRTDAGEAYALILAAKLAGDARGEKYLAPLEKQMSAEQLAQAKEKARAMAAAPEHTKMEVAFLQ